ncbi:efflux transporter periplasmic adaptor subunit [Taibaiella sp. KBW10]|uniref:efflux RND transporter periplasmic adaptor subunit n=1 Tax=Taibaiella sp. KBW10 TaxID=2153357 RepID=UPI000F59BC8D|nr:efflux RND transporter periplasmic adaptor subunit [Taibaiella sp. KBW10]RQO31147.1 efflux transporter periplasmic adaptor subunit [Taibaiella sp. KBW10]
MKHFIEKKSNLLFLFFVATLLFPACKNTPDNTAHKSENTEAEIYTLQQEAAVMEQSFPASLEGKVNVDIRPQIGGYIDKIFIDEGAFVKAGQALFRINASVYLEQKNTASAALAMAKAQLASAKLELDKYKILSENKVVGDFQYQKAKTNYDNAKASVHQQQTMVAAADLNLGFAIVKAPVSGYIGRIPNRIGALVSPTDAQALTTLSQVDEVYAYFSIPETEILKINATRPGATLLQKLQSFEDIVLILADGSPYARPGHINMMDGQFDRSTGSVTLRASFPNPQGLLRSGNTGRIIMKSTETGVYKIPLIATYELQDKIFVGLLDGKNRMQRVELKNYTKSGDYYLLKTGFKPGDRIIANELSGISENALIKPKAVK